MDSALREKSGVWYKWVRNKKQSSKLQRNHCQRKNYVTIKSVDYYILLVTK